MMRFQSLSMMMTILISSSSGLSISAKIGNNLSSKQYSSVPDQLHGQRGSCDVALNPSHSYMLRAPSSWFLSNIALNAALDALVSQRKYSTTTPCPS